MTPQPKAEYGITCHVLRPINLCVSDSFHQAALSLARGDEVILTPAVIEANRGTDGVCAVLDNLDTPGAAIRRGPWPAGLSRLTPGSFEHLDAREAARVQAHKIEDPIERAQALADVVSTYGVVRTSRTHMTISPAA